MKHARILVECQSVVDAKPTGIGNYAQGLVSSLAGHESIDGYFFDFLGRNNYRAQASNFQPIAIRHIPGRMLSLVARLTGLQLPIEAIVMRRYDWIIYPNYVSQPSLTGSHNLIVVYDLAFMDMPETLDEKNLAYLRSALPKSIKRATKILCISNFTRDRLLHHFPEVDPENVISCGIPLTVTPSQDQALSERLAGLGVSSKKYMLFLGTLEPRKNLLKLVEAYVRLPADIRDEYALVLAGGLGWKSDGLLDEIKRYKLSGYNIILTGYVSNDERVALYANTSLYVMPSHYEGFGMPILEAMSFDLPCVASDIPVFREVAGDSIDYFDKDSATSIAKCISRRLRSQRSQSYTHVMAKYSWDEVGKVVYSALS